MGKMFPKHNVLNPVEQPLIQGRMDINNTDVAATLRGMMKEHYAPNAIAGTGPYKGIVLRVEGYNEPLAGSWLSAIIGGATPPKPLVRIKVRIPEIHSSLPIPSTIGTDSEDAALIDMYPTFIAQNDGPELATPPEPGSLVWVDFGNKVNFTDPIYIRPVMSTQATPGAAGPGSAQQKHIGACAASVLAKPSGDAMSGKNVPLSHSGLPLLPRKPATVVSGEHKLVKGHRNSQVFADLWTKAISQKGVPGITWMGSLPSNGAEDDGHEYGKRETIVFAPNIVEFSAPVELIYFFHGYKEFGNNYDFFYRFAPGTRRMSEAGRNFVLVIPELPWSVHSKEPRKRSDADRAWKGNDNFGSFHNEILQVISTVFSNKAKIGYITVVGHSAGGGAVKTAAIRGFESVRPNRIVFGDASYQDYLQVTWDKYISKHPTTELEVLSADKGSPWKMSQQFFRNVAQSETVYYEIINNRDHRKTGDLSLYFVNPRKTAPAAKQQKPVPGADPATQEGDPANIQPTKSQLLKQPSASPPASQNANISPSVKEKVKLSPSQTTASVREAVPFTEARVAVKSYGSLKGTEQVLVGVPSSNSQQKLHKLVAKRLAVLNSEWLKENSGSSQILIASGWRAHKWASIEQYNAYLQQKYPGQSIEESRKWIGFDSPHETGLAMDIGNNGLTPDSKSIPYQKQTKLYNWMVANAHKFGFTPYKLEPWHWECALPKDSWASGEEFTSNLAVRVENPGSGGVPYPGDSHSKGCVAALGNLREEKGDMARIASQGETKGGLDLSGKKKLITELAQQIGIEPEVAYAFFQVESNNGAFVCQETGRPLIRFEPHVFADPRRLLQAGVKEEDVPWRGNNFKERQANWLKLGYRHGSSCSTNYFEYKALEDAAKINEDLAYQSISVGLAQIMGFNCRRVGYKTAKEMFEAFSVSEENQIRAFFNFIKGPVVEALKRSDYVTAAKHYNGIGKEQLYAKKIETYYNKFKAQGIPT